MRKYFIVLLIAASLFVSAGLNFNVLAGENESAKLTLKATPDSRKLARLERIELDKKEVIIPCPPNPYRSQTMGNSPCYDNFYGLVDVKTFVSNPKNVPLTYEYKVSGGRIKGEGANVTWDLSGLRPRQTFTITVSIKGKRGVSEETQTRQIAIEDCYHCDIYCACPTISVTNGNSNIRASESAVFTARVEGGTGGDITYNWTVSQSEIVAGQGTSQIKVKTTREMTGEIRATLEIGGYGLCPECPRTAFLVTSIIK